MKITRDDDFGGAVLNCAVRYCLGRKLYMLSLLIDKITPICLIVVIKHKRLD